MVMDKTFRALLIVLTIGIAISGIFAGFALYADMRYENTFKSSYNYKFSIYTDSVLENVKIYVPLPSGNTGNSEIGLEAGKKPARGLPEDWEIEILGADNWIMLEMNTDRMEPQAKGEEISFFVTSDSKKKIDTKNPIKFAEVLRPVNNPERIACEQDIGTGAQCYMYTGQVFVYFLTEKDANVQIDVSLTGENSWDIFNPESNMFSDTQSVTIIGGGKGWYKTTGMMNAAIGIYR